MQSQLFSCCCNLGQPRATLRNAPRRVHDLPPFGRGLDKLHVVSVGVCFALFTGVLIWYAVYLDAKVRESARQLVATSTTSTLERDPEDPTQVFVPLPEITVCLALAPDTALLQFPAPDAGRVSFFADGISASMAEDLDSDDAAELGQSAGTFLRGPALPDFARLRGQEYDMAWNGVLEAQGNDGKTVGAQGYLKMGQDGLIRVRLMVSHDVSASASQSLNLPPAPAIVYLSDPGGAKPEWLRDSLDGRAVTGQCRDIAARNATSVVPAGSYLMRYSQRNYFKKNGDHTKASDLEYRTFEFTDVLRMSDSRIQSTDDVEGNRQFIDFADAQEAATPGYVRDFVRGPTRCGYDDNKGCLTLFDIFLQYDGDLTITNISLAQSYDVAAAFSDLLAVAGAGFQGIVATGTVVFTVLSMRRRKFEEDRARRVAERAENALDEAKRLFALKSKAPREEA